MLTSAYEKFKAGIPVSSTCEKNQNTIPFSPFLSTTQLGTGTSYISLLSLLFFATKVFFKTMT